MKILKVDFLRKSINLQKNRLGKEKVDKSQTVGIREEPHCRVHGFERLIKEYYGQLYAFEFGILNEMGKLLKRNKLPKLSQEPTDQLNSPVSFLEILIYIYPFHEESLKPTQLSKRPHAKGRKLTIPHNAWKTEDVIFSNSFYDGCIIQRQKPDKDIVRKEKKKKKTTTH